MASNGTLHAQRAGPFSHFFAALYAGFGVQSPYLPALLDDRGLRPEAIGMVLAAGTAVRLAGSGLPLIERKARLAALLSTVAPPLHYSDYHRGQGRAFHQKACELSLEGIVSKRADAPYAPGSCGLWLKVKCLNREEFVVVGWTDPEGRRPLLGALLLAYYDPDGRPMERIRVRQHG